MDLNSLLASIKQVEEEAKDKALEPDKRGVKGNKLRLKVPFIDCEKQPEFRGHRVLGAFGIDKNREYVSDPYPDYLHLPDQCLGLNVNLDRGFDESVLFEGHYGEKGFKAYRRIKMDYYFKWITSHGYVKKRPSVKPELPRFVAIAGNISALLITPYELREDWVINATKFHGYIFLDKVRAPNMDILNKRVASNSAYERKERMGGYHGSKLLDLITSKLPEKPDYPIFTERHRNNGLNEYEKHFQAIEFEFGVHQVLGLVEVDALDPLTKEKVEVRIMKKIKSQRDDEVFMKYKQLQGWGKCIVAGITRVVYGVRWFKKMSSGRKESRARSSQPFIDEIGILEELRVVQTKDIPDMCEHHWSPHKCYNFLDRVLNFVHEKVAEDEPTSVYQITWKLASDTLDCVKMNDPAQEQVLPNWFIEANQSTAND